MGGGHAGDSFDGPCEGDQHREKIDIDPSYTGVTYVAEVRPSLGEHTRRRLWGCLEDGTVDKVRGTVFEARVMR